MQATAADHARGALKRGGGGSDRSAGAGVPANGLDDSPGGAEADSRSDLPAERPG